MRFFAVTMLAAVLPALASAQPAADLAKAKSVLAELDGTLAMTGLREPVEILRDEWGIAHIYAKNTDDLFFAQGFVAAQDRLFQLDLWRRQGNGEQAEVLGPDALEADKFARLMKYRGDMNAEWAAYSPDAKAIATAFTRGINAAIDRFGDKLPIEFTMLGFKPAKWKPEDVLGRMSGIYMSQNFRSEIDRARLIASVGIAKARWLAPVDPPRDYESALNAEDLNAIDARILAGYNAATKSLPFKPAKTESNNWVIAGSRTASGKPQLASDPHRALALPSLRYMVHLHAPGWNVIGAGEPALPGVAIGHNERIVWGFTIAGIDQADFYVEETNPDNANEYKADGAWRKMDVVRESIAVKGKPPEAVELRYTRHGPVLFRDAKRHRAYALKWVGLEPGGAAYLRSLSVARSQNKGEFLAALEGWKVPGLNFVYADVDGTIGWAVAGRTPVRAKHDGLLPVPGDGGFEWTGHLPIREMPQLFNPEVGFIATANQNILPEGYPHTIGYEFAPPYRFERIRQVLNTAEKWRPEQSEALQQDAVSLPAMVLVGLLRKEKWDDPKLEPYVRRLTDWDGRLSVDSTAGSLYALWFRALQDRFYEGFASGSLKSTSTLMHVLTTADPKWLGDDAKAVRSRLLQEALAKAVKQLKALPAAQRERWGALHVAHFRHPLSTAFDLTPVERPGDETTPNNTRYDDKFRQIHGASYRQVFDLADWDRGRATSTPGQSGQPGSPHYDDLLPLWAKGEYFPLAYSRPKVEGVTNHRLKLISK